MHGPGVTINLQCTGHMLCQDETVFTVWGQRFRKHKIREANILEKATKPSITQRDTDYGTMAPLHTKSSLGSMQPIVPLDTFQPWFDKAAHPSLTTAGLLSPARHLNVLVYSLILLTPPFSRESVFSILASTS